MERLSEVAFSDAQLSQTRAEMQLKRANADVVKGRPCFVFGLQRAHDGLLSPMKQRHNLNCVQCFSDLFIFSIEGCSPNVAIP